MKKMSKIIIIIGMVVLSYNVNAQSVDMINFKAVHLVAPSLPKVNLTLDCPPQLIKALLGAPSVINKLDWIAVPENVEEYVYFSNNSIYVDTDDSWIWGYEVRTTDLYVSINATGIKIGDNINKVIQQQFPNSYLSKTNGLITVALSNDLGEDIESYLYFYYDSNNLITEMGIRESN